MLKKTSGYTVATEDITYFENSQGFLARPEESGSFPGVVMIHEWWGLNDNIKEMARMLASSGYFVLAVDLYDGEVATTPERARQLVTSLDQVKAVQNMRMAVSYLRTQQHVIRIASLGWCFGGGMSLQLALSGETLNATVIYYGSLVTDEAKLSPVHWPVLGIFGDRDTSIPVSNVKKFEATLNQLSIENEIYIYPGVGHAFANPSGMNYAPEPTKDAWEKTIAFLEKHLRHN